jgi:hypothetical protein
MNELEKLETVIKEGLTIFYKVGNALWEIRERQLYAGEYKTFDEYCSLRWGMKSKRAYQLMASAIVRENLLSTNVDTMPTNEAQIRSLVSLADDLQPVAWSIAVEASHELDAPVTQSIVKQAVKVINEMMTTRAITVGSEQFSVSDLLRNQVVNEVVEARARQKQHIKDNTPSRQVARYCAVWDGKQFQITDTSSLSIGTTYQILVYTVGDRNHD